MISAAGRPRRSARPASAKAARRFGQALRRVADEHQDVVTPRLLILVRMGIQCLAPSPPSPAPDSGDLTPALGRAGPRHPRPARDGPALCSMGREMPIPAGTSTTGRPARTRPTRIRLPSNGQPGITVGHEDLRVRNGAWAPPHTGGLRHDQDLSALTMFVISTPKEQRDCRLSGRGVCCIPETSGQDQRPAGRGSRGRSGSPIRARCRHATP